VQVVQLILPELLAVLVEEEMVTKDILDKQ